jgi:C4-dicarboxylate-specific signal transduction histidine kinase/DNA-binding winged helix-turn-helix (wHTH) protein
MVLPLGSRALDILIYLAERPGEVVAKQELMDHVWSDVTVEEGSLRVHVAAIRKALADGQFGNRYIANIKGRGYSFVSTVVPLTRNMESRNDKFAHAYFGLRAILPQVRSPVVRSALGASSAMEVTLSRKGAKSRTRGRKLHLTEAKARVGRARKTRADLEQELKACRREIANARERLAEATMQQTATSEMLRLISNSPIQSVLDAVAEHAARLCDAANAEITASIAPEVTQPITAIVTNAQAARHFLNRRAPDLDEVRQALDCIVRDAYRASDVIYRIRGLLKEAPLKRERAEINGAIRDVLELTRGEATKNGVSVRTQFAEPSPVVQADRVQLQQVILNLIINAVEAMSSMREGARELLICTEKAESNGALVAVRDSGPGLDLKSVDRLSEAFYTTKIQGMGIGLAICRSIIEAHGGRMWAGANEPRGAVFQFTVPLEPDETVPAGHADPMPVA